MTRGSKAARQVISPTLLPPVTRSSTTGASPSDEVGDRRAGHNLSSDGEILLLNMNQKFNELKCELLNDLKNEFISLIREKDEKIHQLEEKVTALERSVCVLGNRVEDLESEGRQTSVILSGSALPPAPAAGEQSAQIACDLIKNKLKIVLTPESIVTSHRLGSRPPNQSPDKRSILLKLSHRERKRDLLSACRTVKPSGLYINESLTPARSKLLYSLRQLKKQFPTTVDGCGSQNGRIYAWIKTDIPSARNSKVFFSSFDDLDKWSERSLGVKASLLPVSSNQQ